MRNENTMSNIMDSVMNKKDLDGIRAVLKNAYKGGIQRFFPMGSIIIMKIILILISEIFLPVLNRLL